MNTNKLSLAFNTDLDQRALLDMGFTSEFLESTERRDVTFSKITALPVFGETKQPTKVIPVRHRIVGVHSFWSTDKKVALTILQCVDRTHYFVVRGKSSFFFELAGTSVTPKEAVIRLLNNNLVKGERYYTTTAFIMPGFWCELLLVVCKEPEIIDMTFNTRDGSPVPSRLYFDPKAPTECILSVGGHCYAYNPNVYPRGELTRGTFTYAEEKIKAAKKAAEAKGPGNTLVPKPKQQSSRPGKPVVELPAQCRTPGTLSVATTA